MTYTKHGHHISGTVLNEADRPAHVARCGGPGLCRGCSQEASIITNTSKPYYNPISTDGQMLRQIQLMREPTQEQYDEIFEKCADLAINARTVVTVINALKNEGFLFYKE